MRTSAYECVTYFLPNVVGDYDVRIDVSEDFMDCRNVAIKRVVKPPPVQLRVAVTEAVIPLRKLFDDNLGIRFLVCSACSFAATVVRCPCTIRLRINAISVLRMQLTRSAVEGVCKERGKLTKKEEEGGEGGRGEEGRCVLS